MYLPIFVLLAPLLVDFLSAACLIFVGAAVLAEFDLILFVGVDCGEQGLPIGIGWIAVPGDPITPLIQIQRLIVRVLGVPIKPLIDGVELLLRRGSHVLLGHGPAPQV